MLEILNTKGKMNSMKCMLLARKQDGSFLKKLIKRHFEKDKQLFSKLFRLNFDQFNVVWSLVKCVIALSRRNKVKKANHTQ